MELQIDLINTGAELRSRVARRAPLVERELLTYPEYTSLLSVFSGVRVAQSVVLLCSVLFGRSLFVPLSFFFWPLYCLTF